MQELYVSVHGDNPLKFIKDDLVMKSIQEVIQKYMKRQKLNEGRFNESRLQLLYMMEQLQNKKRGNIFTSGCKNDN